MSRSNPQTNTPNPATRWFEWNGELGIVRYYDKEAKQNVECGSDFTFLLLDQLGTVGGWHDASDSGIYSNEVRDSRQEAMVVKAFKGGVVAEGVYRDIKDRVNAAGGQFVANCYIAFKNGGDGLAIGSLKFKGAALHAWTEFTKAHRADVYKKAVRIHGFTEGKKGRIVYRVPELKLVELTEQTNADALALDKELQEFLSGYFKRTKKDQAEAPPAQHVRDEDMDPPPPSDHDAPQDIDDFDTVPF